MDRFATLHGVVKKLDTIFEDAEKQDFDIHTKTIRGIVLYEVEWRKEHSSIQTRYDDYGKPIPTKPNRKLIIPADNIDGLVELYLVAKDAIPSKGFKAACDLAQSLLSPPIWNSLKSRVGIE